MNYKHNNQPDTQKATFQAMALSAQVLRQRLSGAMTALNQGTWLPEQQQQLGCINQSLFQALRILCNMADAGSVSSPRLEVRNLCSIVDELVSHAADAADLAGKSLHYTRPPAPVFCPVDTQLLERGIYNLLANALKFSPEKSSIKVWLRQRGSMLCLTVQNPTCRPNRLPFGSQLLQPSLDSDGLGLGLAMVLSAAKAHGGTVISEASARHGLRVTMTLNTALQPDSQPQLSVDYAGEWDHALVELSEILPSSAYENP